MKIAAKLLALVVGAVLLVQADVASASLYDATRPTVTIVTPTAGEVADGAMTVSGTAWDNRHVKKVLVKVAGGSYQLAEGTTSWTAEIDTALYPAGWHYVRVRAVDRQR